MSSSVSVFLYQSLTDTCIFTGSNRLFVCHGTAFTMHACIFTGSNPLLSVMAQPSPCTHAAADVGTALATLWPLDPLQLRLTLGEWMCPLDHTRLCEDEGMEVGLTCDGHAYGFSSIVRWLATEDRSPLTNLDLANKRVLHLNFLRDVLEAYLKHSCALRQLPHMEEFPNTLRACRQSLQMHSKLRRTAGVRLCRLVQLCKYFRKWRRSCGDLAL